MNPGQKLKQIFNLLHSSRILGDTCSLFNTFCIAGLKANSQRIHDYLEKSLMLVTALNPVIGYDKAAAIAKQAHKDGSTLKEACVTLGYLSAEKFDAAVQPEKMTHPQ